MRPVNCTCGQVGLIAYTKFPWKKKKVFNCTVIIHFINVFMLSYFQQLKKD